MIPALLALATRSSSAGGDLVLVVHASNKENPSMSEAKRLFLGDNTFWPGNVPVKLFVRPSDSPAADAFFRAIQIAPARFKRLWQEKQLSGQGNAPENVAAASALVAKVAADPGGVGFALSDEVPANPPGVRVIALH
jgi:hypothetical protein